MFLLDTFGANSFCSADDSPLSVCRNRQEQHLRHYCCKPQTVFIVCRIYPRENILVRNGTKHFYCIFVICTCDCWQYWCKYTFLRIVNIWCISGLQKCYVLSPETEWSFLRWIYGVTLHIFSHFSAVCVSVGLSVQAAETHWRAPMKSHSLFMGRLFFHVWCAKMTRSRRSHVSKCFLSFFQLDVL